MMKSFLFSFFITSLLSVHAHEGRVGATIIRNDGDVKLSLYCEKMDEFNQCLYVTLGREDSRFKVPFIEYSDPNLMVGITTYSELKSQIVAKCKNSSSISTAMEKMIVAHNKNETYNLSFNNFNCLDQYLSILFPKKTIENEAPTENIDNQTFGGIIKNLHNGEKLKLICAGTSASGECQRFHLILNNANSGTEHNLLHWRDAIPCGNNCLRITKVPYTYRALSLVIDIFIHNSFYNMPARDANEAIGHLTNREKINQVISVNKWVIFDFIYLLKYFHEQSWRNFGEKL